jgi:alkylation response protein AidB-like acyl-CoA dehydrogenase
MPKNKSKPKRTREQFVQAAAAYNELLTALDEGGELSPAQLATAVEAVEDALSYAKQMTRIGKPRQPGTPLSNAQRQQRKYARQKARKAVAAN